MTVFALRGLGNTGKTHTLKAFILKLSELPNSSLLCARNARKQLCDPGVDYLKAFLKSSGDVYALFNVSGKIIAIITWGDTRGAIEGGYESIREELNGLKIDRIDYFFCAQHLYGATVDTAKEIAGSGMVISVDIYDGSSSGMDSDYQRLDDTRANYLLKLLSGVDQDVYRCYNHR